LPARLAQKASRTSETPEPTQTPFGQPNPRRMGFLKGSGTQPPAAPRSHKTFL
jgi:hypothetical protein